MSTQALELATVTRDRLDDLFGTGASSPIPIGRTRGTALLAAGTAAGRVLQGVVRAFFWKGKVFRPETSDLKNLLSPFGVPGIRARVYEDASWFDNKPAIIIDYSRTSVVASMIRDEIRLVAPGLYLGQIFLWKKRIGHFMLEVPVPATVTAPAATGSARS